MGNGIIDMDENTITNMYMNMTSKSIAIHHIEMTEILIIHLVTTPLINTAVINMDDNPLNHRKLAARWAMGRYTRFLGGGF